MASGARRKNIIWMLSRWLLKWATRWGPQDHTYLGNLKFKSEKFDEAEVDFDKAGTLFEEVQNTASRAQLFLTVARMELVVSRVGPSGKYLDLAKKVSKELGDPKPITQAIEEIEKMKEALGAEN
tara:strand:- start:236 stop:610 length:375 start_codon:yes stop_codon:yes gene_type:complete